MSALTQARTAQLVAELRRARARVLCKVTNEFSVDGLIGRNVGVEAALCDLVVDLAGWPAAASVRDALHTAITEDELAAVKAADAARIAGSVVLSAAAHGTGAKS